MAGETVITIIGNLTADPELRTLSNGNPVASFTIASTPRTYNRQTQQYEDGTALFLRCSAWNDLARHISQSCSKGMRVIAQGRLSQRSYQAQDGTNRTVLEVVANNINFCGSKADNAGALSAPAEGPRVGAPAPEYSRGPGDDFAMIEDEGDLPF